jgi:tRNA 5-methylaminomethyl-2-thiouridine biosynthesis bifunctional protein
MPDRIVPATLVFRDGTLYAPDYDDIYHSAAGALAQAAYVFLGGNDLPNRWQSRRHFTIVETGFGTGANFLATWMAWRDDPARCERLHFVSVEKHPFGRNDLRTAILHHAAEADLKHREAAHALADAWPPLLPGLHRLEFEGGRVTLTLVFGDARDWLPRLALRADAFYLDGFAPDHNQDLWSPEIFRSLARLADTSASFATYTSSGQVKQALEQAGFVWRKRKGFADKRAMLTGQYAPRWRMRRHEPPAPAVAHSRDALVIGAGIAGCAIAERLAARGWQVTLIDSHAHPAGAASGNPAGVFHPLVTRDDNIASRLSRAGYFLALQRWRELETAGHDLQRSQQGLIQLAEDANEFARMRETIESLGIPNHYAQAYDANALSHLLGTRVVQGGWLFPEGGSISPARIAVAQCAQAGARLIRTMSTYVARLERRGDTWAAFNAEGNIVANASIVVLANSHDAARLADLQHAPMQSIRGQLSLIPERLAPHLHLPLIGDGYAVPLADGTLLTGATYEPGDDETQQRLSGHQDNLTRLAALLPDTALAAIEASKLDGRVAFRCVSHDRLPMIGQLADSLPLAELALKARGGPHARDLPRQNGLYGAFAYGSRGLIWASLGAELIVSQIEGEPWPIERDLADAADPARFLMRALRHGHSGSDSN